MEELNLDLIQVQVLAQVALAMLLGGLIGLERELAGKPAGLRTHILVTGAAALFMALADVLLLQFMATVGSTSVQSDPIRVLEAVVTGVSFLGAGTIIRNSNEGEVEGLTTAASLLFAAAVGIAIGLWQVVLAVGLTVLVLVILRGLVVIEGWLQRGGR